MIEIRPLLVAHIEKIVRLHNHAPATYSEYFQPFTFDVPTLQRLLLSVRNDRYFAVLLDDNVAGFYMLRGFDEGYTIPAYGVWVAHEYSGRGIARATLDHAMEVCNHLHCEKLMLKVHPKNHRAKALYESYGFQRVGVDLRNDNLVYELLLSREHERTRASY